jgi:hypothetical protein
VWTPDLVSDILYGLIALIQWWNWGKRKVSAAAHARLRVRPSQSHKMLADIR